MNEQSQEPAEEHAPHVDAPQKAERTGNVEVDKVLDSLENLDDRPVDEHAALFEAAHEALRSALAGAGDAPRDTTGG